jgi:hypothetical protein
VPLQRRAFIKKAALGAALAVPAIESLTKSDILVKSALAATVPTWTARASQDPGSSGSGSITPGIQQVVNGTNAQGIVITPTDINRMWILTITDNGISQPVTNQWGMTYQLNNVTTDHNVVVFFFAEF